MESQFHGLSDLFSQLGLPSDSESIEAFIGKHKPMPAEHSVEDLSIWSESQVAFLKESRDTDADWSDAVDELDAMLH